MAKGLTFSAHLVAEATFAQAKRSLRRFFHPGHRDEPDGSEREDARESATSSLCQDEPRVMSYADRMVQEPGEHHSLHRGFYRQYLLTLLTIIFALSLSERLVLGVVLQNIKTDLDLSDTQLGFLTGIA